ncbi:UDP-N-acetylmuramoyl-L-alanine--D-glutamate ligase [Patescibacteria group bacterium]|nr:UDP-N-acetylmuramoyl-L-alanine--D-glutamate ligase [Patescibacteria group bacterium]MCG2700323.1 UDP-N-acetylmuramoyl-L-alanine--D-glutamate ligase [Candidatus Parcubacteria bacterium]
MEHQLFKNKKITIMGLGLHGGGVGAAKFFCEQGADVLVTDLKTKKQLGKSLDKLKKYKVRYRLGEHNKEDFINTDLVIKNPAVPLSSPYLKIARDNNIEVDSDVNLFFKLCKVPIIGVTGTKGKSTVATLIYEFLKTEYKNTILAGNIGVSPLELLDKIKPDNKVVLELSSFELEDLEKSPHIAVITAIYPDHLDRYNSMEEYIESKKLIFKYQDQNDYLILNYDDQIIRSFKNQTQSKIYFFSTKEKQNGCYLEGNKIIFNNDLVCDTADFQLAGKHNISNALAALTVAKILGIENEKIKKIIRKFKGVANRQELIAVKRGVKYINDTTATMPDAVIQALKTFRGGGIILIAGGQNKGLRYKDLAGEIIKTVNKIVLLPGTASEEIKKELAELKSSVEIIPVSSMEEAVLKSSQIAKTGDIVLLSPGAASFNLFKNEFDRGDQFGKYVRKL